MARVLLTPLARFLREEAAGGVLLIVAAALALSIANGALADLYFGLLETHVGPLTVLHWINDGLMSLFFLAVGLEVKREFAGGRLATWRDRGVPLVAALCGMIAPAMVYLVVVRGDPSLTRGWAIPAATDIAFSLGVLALLGRRVPDALKLLLVTIAVVDDIGAVTIIAIGYTDAIDPRALAAAAAILGAMAALNRAGVARLGPYLLLAAALWLAMLLSGVHPTVAGVLAAFAVPHGGAGAPSPLERLEHRLHPWVVYGIVPLFGFANAGVRFGGVGADDMLARLPLGIALGLVVGKQIGIFGGLRLAAALGVGHLPAGLGRRQLYGLALLCGIGFTMSLFIGGLAFADPGQAQAVKIGVLAGSLLSAVVGYVMLRQAPRSA